MNEKPTESGRVPRAQYRAANSFRTAPPPGRRLPSRCPISCRAMCWRPRGGPGPMTALASGISASAGKESSHVRDGAVAICDVDSGHIKAAVNRAGGTPFTCRDFRQLLERKDVDAVYIATPDHWHAIMAVMAMQAGKDVYSEKPVCKTIQEADAMMNAAERYQRMLQIGAQGRSHHLTGKAVEYMRNGEIGKKISYVDVWHPTNWVGGKSPDSDPPPISTGICGSGRRSGGLTIEIAFISIFAGSWISGPASFATAAITC